MATMRNDEKHLPGTSIISDVGNSTFLWALKFLFIKSKCKKTSFSFDGNNEKDANLPKPNITETCDVNNVRFQEIFQHEEASKGNNNMSMLNVAWRFGRSRIIVASLMRTGSVAFGIVAILSILFNVETDRDLNTRRLTYHLIESGSISNFYASYSLCMLAMYYLKSSSHWINMRTAIRLRTACMSAAYTKSLESSVLNKLQAYQIIDQTDSEPIMALILKGTDLISHSIGLFLCAFAAVMLLDHSADIAILPILIVILLSIVFLLISTKYYNRSLLYLDNKLRVVDEYCRSFNKSTFLNRYEEFTKRFSSALSCQYFASSRVEVLQRNMSFETILIVLILPMVWINHQSSNCAAMAIVFSSIVPVLVFEWRDALDAVLKGKIALDKVKIAIATATPTVLPVIAKNEEEYAISISAAKFQWSSDHISQSTVDSNFVLHIEQMHIPKGQVIGITGGQGSGKTSLILALLGHMPNVTGKISRNGNIAYFPTKPYMEDDKSAKENIIFYEKFDALKYESAMSLVQLSQRCLGSDPLCEDIPVGELELSSQQLQKINLARSLYCDKEIILLEDPLYALQNDADQIFQAVSKKLIEMGKTVIVVSKNESSILRHCTEIYLLESGKVEGKYEFDDLKHEQKYLKNNTVRETMLQYSLPSTELGEQLVRVDKTEHITQLGVIYYVWLFVAALLFSVTNIFCLQIITLLVTTSSHPLVVVFFLYILFAKCITAPYLFKAPSRYNKRIQRTIFKKLLNTSMEYISETKLSNILNLFMDTNIQAHQLFLTTIRCWVEILMIGIIGMELNNNLAGFAMMIFGLISYLVPYFVCRNSISCYADLERKTRCKLLRLITSQYNGRAVIQSFNVVKESHKNIFRIIEENSTAFFIRMSISFGAQFVFHIFNMFALEIIMQNDLVLNSKIYPDRTFEIAQYLMLVMFFFTRIIRSFDNLLENEFNVVVMQQKMDNADSFMVTDSSQPCISTINEA